MSQTQPHVAVLAFPFSTHAAPLLLIIKRLAVSLPNTLFTFFSTEPSNNTIFSASKQPDNIIPYNVSDGVPDGYVFTGKRQEHIELFMNAADRNFRKAIDTAVVETGRRLSCLVTDSFIWFGAEMAEDWNVPWIPLWTAGPNSLSAHVYTDLIRERMQLGGNQNRRLELIPGMSKLRVADLPEGILSGNLQSMFSVMLHEMVRRLPQAAAVCINSFEELDPEITNDLKSKFKKFMSIGPFNILSRSLTDDKYGCLQWLDKQKKKAGAPSVAYISFGTVANPSQKEITAIAEALEASKVPFIWSIRGNLQENLPNWFLERTKSEGNGMVVDWAPQVEVLEHEAVGAFVTHCGWNSILESVAAGVPMIGRPFFGDQGINGRMMEHVWQIGVIVDDGIFTKNALLASFEFILSQDRGENVKENIKKLKQLSHNAVGPGGSSMLNYDALRDIILSAS